MKKFYNPIELLVIPLLIEDVLTTSGDVCGTDVEGGWHENWTQPAWKE